MISDVDEIPDPKKISEFKTKNKYACFLQKNFQSKLNLLNVTDKYWMGTKICQKKYLKSPQWLRNIKTKKRSFWKFYKPKQPQLIIDGGWHFSFLKKPKDIAKKIMAYSHQEFYKDEFINEKKIEDRINNKKDLFDRKINYEKVLIDNSFPEYVFNNKSMFKDWII
jgi:beta-1,4-mannosyl-glycoprotein beta-1,4-N-acetylglucosaminyltransferase